MRLACGRCGMALRAGVLDTRREIRCHSFACYYPTRWMRCRRRSRIERAVFEVGATCHSWRGKVASLRPLLADVKPPSQPRPRMA
jgi:hypothetical protein